MSKETENRHIRAFGRENISIQREWGYEETYSRTKESTPVLAPVFKTLGAVTVTATAVVAGAVALTALAAYVGVRYLAVPAVSALAKGGAYSAKALHSGISKQLSAPKKDSNIIDVEIVNKPKHTAGFTRRSIS